VERQHEQGRSLDNGAGSENVSLIVLDRSDKPARPRVDQRLVGGDGYHPSSSTGNDRPNRNSVDLSFTQRLIWVRACQREMARRHQGVGRAADANVSISPEQIYRRLSHPKSPQGNAEPLSRASRHEPGN
jgi:hypothetical protein